MSMLKKKKTAVKLKENGAKFVPGESEKISARRAQRIKEKFQKSSRIRGRHWRIDSQLETLGFILIGLLNLYLVWPFFGREAFVTSYSGPVIPFLAKMISLVGIPLSYSMEIINIIFFLLFPVSYYFFIKRINQEKGLVAILSSLIISLPFSPFSGARIRSVFYSVEGPHMASLSVVPLAIAGLMAFLHDGGIRNLVLTALSAALVGLISPFGLLTYLIFTAIGTFSEVLLGHGRLKIFRTTTALLLTAALSSFWYNPGFFWWMVTGPMGEELRIMVWRLIPIFFFTVPVIGAFGYLLFDRKPGLQPLFFASFLTLAFLVITIAGGGIMPSSPSRYIPEMGMAFAFLTGLGVEMIYEHFEKKKKVVSRWSLAGLVFILGIAILLGRSWVLGHTQVLGYWVGVERGELWEAREHFSGVYSLMGYLISGTAIGLMVMMWSKTKA